MPFDLESLFTIETAPANIRAIVEDIARTVGVPTPTVLIDYSLRDQINAYTSWRETLMGGIETGVFLPPDPIAAFHGVDNLRAAIAHELGHIANDDREREKRFNHRREFDADSFAKAHGFDLTPVLKLTPMDKESQEHPAVSARLKRIQRGAK